MAQTPTPSMWEEMPGQLAAKHAQRLAARRQRPAHEFFDGAGVGHVVGQRREVVQTVRVGHELVVVHVFGDLLVAAVQEADIGLGLVDHLAVEFQHQAQHAVGRRVGGPHVENHAIADQVVGFRVVAVRGCGGSRDGVRGLDFFGGIAHAGAAGVRAQSRPIRKGLMKIFTCCRGRSARGIAAANRPRGRCPGSVAGLRRFRPGFEGGFRLATRRGFECRRQGARAVVVKAPPAAKVSASERILSETGCAACEWFGGP